MTDGADTPVVPTPAATVAVVRDGDRGIEVLLLQRNGRGVFGGMWVFPGGQVDIADLCDGGADGTAPGDGEPVAARRAAVREAREEAGIDLDPDGLVVHSRWLPPPEVRRRFATWFFLGAVGPDAAVAVDDAEIVDHRWISPGDAIRLRDLGEIRLAPPTWMTLWWLDDQPTVAAAAAAATAATRRFETRIDEARSVVMWEGDAGWASGDPEAAGARRRLWMDPAGWRAEFSAA